MGWFKPRLQTCQLSPRAGRLESLVKPSTGDVCQKHSKQADSQYRWITRTWYQVRDRFSNRSSQQFNNVINTRMYRWYNRNRALGLCQDCTRHSVPAMGRPVAGTLCVGQPEPKPRALFLKPRINSCVVIEILCMEKRPVSVQGVIFYFIIIRSQVNSMR